MRRIATEEAFATPDLVEALRGIARSNWRAKDVQFWRGLLYRANDERLANLLDLDGARLARMDASGTDMHLLSLTSPGVQMFEAETACAIAADANDRLAAAIARHPTRYAGLGAFAPQAPHRAVKEMERCIRELKLNGFIVNSHTDGEYLDAEKFWPILEAAEALDAPIYIHPRALPDTADESYRDLGLWTAMWGFQAETGLHGARLLFSGVFDRFPKLRIVLGHMGEGLPYWVYRMDHMYPKMAFMAAHRLQLKPSEYLKRNFAITTSGMNHHPALRYCIEVLGAENILWAIDYPYQDHDEAAAFLNSAPIAEEDRAAIAHRNAERLFKIAPQA